MALSDDITALPETITDGHTGHLGNHETIHAGLKAHDSRLQGAEEESARITESLKTKWLELEDLNDITTEGRYSQFNASPTTGDRNYPITKPGILEVLRNRDHVLQRYTDMVITTVTYQRYASVDEDGNHVWRPWRRFHWAAPELGSKDLNDVVEEGYYPQPYGVNATPARNYPVVEAGILEVFVNKDRYLQRYTDMVHPSMIYQRYSVVATDGSVEWRGWELAGGAIDDSAEPVGPAIDYEIILEADYTGQTDALPDIQAAITQAQSEGKPIRMKPGTLRVDSPIKVVGGLTMYGAGPGKTIIRPQGTANALEYVPSKGGPTISGVRLSDFEIDGIDQHLRSDGVYSPTLSKGMYFQKVRMVEMRNLVIRNTGATGLGIDHVTGVIENVWAINCGRLNDGTKGGGSGIGIGVGWLDPDFEPLTIANCHTEDNGRFGIFIEAQDAGVYPSGITITGCTARGNKDGFGDAGSTGTIITGCHALDNERSGIAIDQGTISVGAPGIQSKVIGNHIENNGDFGIVVFAGRDTAANGIQLINNTITGTAGDGIKIHLQTNSETVVNQNAKISGNEISHNGGKGIYIDGWSSRVESLILRHFWITGNRIWENGDTGIRVYAKTDYLVISGNHAWDHRDTPLQGHSLWIDQTHTNLHVTDDNLWFTGEVTVPAA